MSSESDENSPLLAEPLGQHVNITHEHPVFLRVAHSPWAFFGQKSLLASRTLLALYTTTVWIYKLVHDIEKNKVQAKMFAFEADVISFTLQVIYYWISTVWTAQHYFSPRNRPQRETEGASFFTRFRDRATSIVQIPRTTQWAGARRFAFSAFYSSATTFPIVTAIIHWTVFGVPHKDHFDGNQRHEWIHFSLHSLSAIIALVEVLFLSSVNHIQPFVGHALVVSAVPAFYILGWVRFGRLVTGFWPNRYVNPRHQPGRKMVFVVLASMALSLSTFIVIQGLHRARDMTSKKAGCKRRS